jgi:hypothetical protein
MHPGSTYGDGEGEQSFSDAPTPVAIQCLAVLRSSSPEKLGKRTAFRCSVQLSGEENHEANQNGRRERDTRQADTPRVPPLQTQPGGYLSPDRAT